jgi:nucleoside-diphosphate-sugar epimerase
MMTHSSPLAIPSWDLQRCFDIVGTSRWQQLSGQRLFITGGTGFVGKWLLGALIHANEALDLGCHITILSRNPDAFLRDWPLISGQITWVAGDVCTLDIGSKPYDVIIHAATDVASQIPSEELYFSIIEGTRRIVSLARHGQASRLLLLSSGAVYGQLSESIQRVPETYDGAQDPIQPESAYGEGKRLAEQLVAEAAASGGMICRIARLFSTVGPHFPLDQHFAIGNFIRDALAKRLITINGDGSPVRSYLYAADMVGWLWSILLEEATPSPVYNVGSDQGISILDLAKLVGQTVGSTQPVELKNSLQSFRSKPIRTLGGNHYVPDCNSVLRDLKLPQPLGLTEAIIRTANWYKLSAHKYI